MGGTRKAVEQGLARLEMLLPIANRAVRTETPASELVLGLQCGGSDAWSGVTSNPALGNAADALTTLGATVILSGNAGDQAEHLLYARAASPDISDKLAARMAWWERYTAQHGAAMDNNPSPGTKAGGLTTILEKSLGAVAKGGASPLMDVIEYAEPLTRKGLVFMDRPGLRPVLGHGPGGVRGHADRIHDRTRFGIWLQALAIDQVVVQHRNLHAHARRHRSGLRRDRHRRRDRQSAEILDLLLDIGVRQARKSELGYGEAGDSSPGSATTM